jgi:hypothetical protein
MRWNWRMNWRSILSRCHQSLRILLLWRKHIFEHLTLHDFKLIWLFLGLVWFIFMLYHLICWKSLHALSLTEDVNIVLNWVVIVNETLILKCLLLTFEIFRIIFILILLFFFFMFNILIGIILYMIFLVILDILLLIDIAFIMLIIVILILVLSLECFSCILLLLE